MKVKITAYEKVQYLQCVELPDKLWEKWLEVYEEGSDKEFEEVCEEIFEYIDINDIHDVEFVDLDMWDIRKGENK